MPLKQYSIFFIIASLLLLLLTSSSPPFRILFWNVENLFDCFPDSIKNNKEFLPSSIRAWHYGRYKKKLYALSKTISAIGEGYPPALAGLCEVENSRVMNDLTRYSPLKEWGYRYVLTDSPDQRGINVALLYQRDRFRLLQWTAIRIDTEKHGIRPTRDILHVSGLLHNGDTLDVLVCHLPSKAGGKRITAQARKQVASIIRQQSDSILQCRLSPQLVIMGDFNDPPQSKTIEAITGKVPGGEHLREMKLFSIPLQARDRRVKGTYKYKERWEVLDQFIINGKLWEKSGYGEENPGKIADYSFLLERDSKQGGLKPFRTYNGMKYNGGYSDHLPIWLDLDL